MTSSSENERTFSAETQELVDIQAAAFLKALRMRDEERNRIEVSEELEFQAQEEIEPYDEKYFFTRVFSLLFAPLCSGLLLAGLTILAHGIFIRVAPGETGKLFLVSSVLAVFVLGWIANAFVRGLASSLYNDGSRLIPIEPRFLILGLLGSKGSFPNSELVVSQYYESLLNFIPGWNSWVIKMDTSAQIDSNIHVLKHVRDGDILVELISPGLPKTKRKLFRRR